jgi:SAM-dependent methyltransferase
MVGVIRDAVAWHDVECAAYAADLPLWRELAEERGGPVLELGCGSGRVALDLAARGHRVVGVDADGALLGALAARARERGLRAETALADVRALALPRRFPLVIAPMQVVQLLGGAVGRARMLARTRDQLEPGGLAALALADPFDAVPAAEALPPLPDVREHDGWVLSSRPVSVRGEHGQVTIERLRQAVSPAGDLREELFTVQLDALDAATLEREAQGAGLEPRGRRTVPETPDHVGSTVVLLERP